MPTLAEVPHLVAQIDPRRNGPVDPRRLRYASNKKLWWRCQFGHAWKATVNHRTAHPAGCPACGKRRKVVAVTGRGRRGSSRQARRAV